MEHHHFDQCVMILNSQGNQILSNLSPQEYSRVIILLEEAILATDLANYFGKRDHFFQLTNSDSLDWQNDAGHRSLLRCMLMTACDIAAITKPWPVQKVVADLVMSEFYQQGMYQKAGATSGPMLGARSIKSANKLPHRLAGDIERNELKIEPIDMMNRDKRSQLPSMQISFIDSICAPIYTAFAKLFPLQLHPLIEGCLQNRTLWRQMAESKAELKIPAVNYFACDSDGPTTDNECANQTLPTSASISKSEMSLSSQLPVAPHNVPASEKTSAADIEDSYQAARPCESSFACKSSIIDSKLAETGIPSLRVGTKKYTGQRRSV
jgi:hypothetical protein